MTQVQLAPSWAQHFHDDTGYLPAVGWKVYTYESRTVDKLLTYQDPEGIVEHSNPIILNSRGEYPGMGLYLIENRAYTLELRSLDGTVKRTVDNIIVDDAGASFVDAVLTVGGVQPINQNIPLTVDDVHAEANGNYPVDTLKGNDRSKVDNLPDNTIQDLSNKIDVSEKAVANGVATLNEAGKVPEWQLPGVVAEVQEAYVVGSTPYASDWLSETDGGAPLTPADSTIYVILSSGIYENMQYRWGGSQYVEISSSLTLGTGSDNAYYGDKGQTAYEHSQVISGNPHNVTKNDIGLGAVDNTSDLNKPISNATQAALDNTVKLSGDQTINGVKKFNDPIYAQDGIDLNGYKLPTGAGEKGQVLMYPSSGDTLEFKDIIDSIDDLPVTGGYAISAIMDNPDPYKSWSIDNLVISKNNKLLDTVTSPDTSFDIDTGIFTAPEDGYYYFDARASLTPTRTTISTELVTAWIRVGIIRGNISYFTGSAANKDYLGYTVSGQSSGVLYMTKDQTLTAQIDAYNGVSTSFTPWQYSRTAKLNACSFSAHLIGKADVVGGVNIDGTPLTIPSFDENGELKTDTTLRFKDEKYLDLGFTGAVNVLPTEGMWNASIGTNIEYTNTSNETVLLGDEIKSEGSALQIMGNTITNTGSGNTIIGNSIDNSGFGRVIIGRDITDTQLTSAYQNVLGNGNIESGATSLIGRFADSTNSLGSEGQVLARDEAGELVWTTVSAGGIPDVLDDGISYTRKFGAWTRPNTIYHRFSNATAVAIPAGKAIYIDADGNGVLASAGSKATAQNVMVTTEVCPPFSTAYAMLFGDLTLDTSIVKGQYYLSATTAGEITTTEPSYPSFSVKIGVVTDNDDFTSQLLVNPDSDPQYSSGSSTIFPPSVILSYMGENISYPMQLFKAVGTGNLPTLAATLQSDQYYNGGCDPLKSSGGRLRRVSIELASCAVSTATVASQVFVTLSFYGLKADSVSLLTEVRVPLDSTTNVNIYNSMNLLGSTSGSIDMSLDIPLDLLYGVIITNVDGSTEDLNAFRNAVVALTIY